MSTLEQIWVKVNVLIPITATIFLFFSGCGSQWRWTLQPVPGAPASFCQHRDQQLTSGPGGCPRQLLNRAASRQRLDFIQQRRRKFKGWDSDFHSKNFPAEGGFEAKCYSFNGLGNFILLCLLSKLLAALPGIEVNIIALHIMYNLLAVELSTY